MKIDIYNTDKKYNIIYADPPWKFGGSGGLKWAPAAHYYDVMTFEQLEEFGKNVKKIADDNCLLFMWVVSSALDKCIEKIKSIEHCKGCSYCSLITKREVLHAESNAISKCAKWYSSTEGATLYVTLSPCFDCAKMIIQSGIKLVCYEELYRDSAGLDFLKQNNIEVKCVKV